jgi:molybdate transport system substrate-binding protein
MFPAVKTDNVALQLSQKHMALNVTWQGKIQTLVGLRQKWILSAAKFIENASFPWNFGPHQCKFNRVPPMKMHIFRCAYLAMVLCLPALASSSAAEVKVLTAGAFKQIVLALVPDFETQTGNKVIVDNDTAGGLQKRIESGEAFDVAIITPTIVDGLAASGKIVPNSRVNLATVSIGVVVKEGAPKPDIGTVEAFKNALLSAKSVAYIDPASGGSSGIYVDKLLERLGIADQVRPKAKLKKGGYVADLIVSGEAELGVHQISEIVPVKGAVLVGPLPKEIQNTTTYAAGLSAAAQNKDAAQALIKTFSGPAAANVFKAKGMEPAN